MCEEELRPHRLWRPCQYYNTLAWSIRMTANLIDQSKMLDSYIIPLTTNVVEGLFVAILRMICDDI